MNSTFCSVVAVNNYSILFLHRNLVQVSGDPSERVPPVPIPNTEVKPLSPDGTARASVWESRKSPDYSNKNPGQTAMSSRGFLRLVCPRQQNVVCSESRRFGPLPNMDLPGIIGELRAEWQRLSDAITALERLERGTTRRRGKAG